MTNKSFNPMFVSALDILTGALGVFIILNFLNTRLIGTTEPPPPPLVASREIKKPEPEERHYRQTRPAEPRWSYTPPSAPAPKPVPTPEVTTPTPKPEPAKPAPVENIPPSPPQDPVAVDLMKQTKGAVTLLLQQEGKAKQTVEFMLRQGKKTWKPSRNSKYQNSDFRYEKGLTYFYQDVIEPGTYEVLVRVKRTSRNAGNQPFALYGKVIPPGQKDQTHNFCAYAVGGNDWVSAGTFTVTANNISFKSALPPASADKLPEEPENKTNDTPKTKPKKVGKWG